jgi:aspartate racemase
MKTIGIIGGMSWESTLLYYKTINQLINKELGKLHSAKIAMYSLDFEPIELLQHSQDWDKTAEILSNAAKSVERAGADFLLIATNTMHKVAPIIEQNISIPLLHIADATGKKLKEDKIKKVGLLGTAFTMEQDFYKQRLVEKYDLEVMIPTKQDREIVHKVIYNELCLGNILDSSKTEYIRIIDQLRQNGAEAVVLGCTEIATLINQNDVELPLYDTVFIHSYEAVKEALL